MKQPEYGTLEPVALQPKKRSRAFVTVVAAFLVVSAVVAVSFSTGFMQAEQAVDTNRARGKALLCPTLKKQFTKVCTDKTKRFVIAQFNAEQTKLVPTVSADADPFNWQNDFLKFKNMLPSFVPATAYAKKDDPAEGGEPGVAFAVYDLPVYKDKSETSFQIIPTFVTYMDPKADKASKYLGGSFMGSAALAASCAQATVTIDQPSHMDTYKSFCMKVLNQVIDTEMQTLGKSKYLTEGAIASLYKGPNKKMTVGEACDFKPTNLGKCPFGGPADQEARKPCNACAGVDMAVGALWKKGKCCEEITKICGKGNDNVKGCNAYQVAIYNRNCDKNFAGVQEPKTKLLSGMKENELAQCLPICARTCSYIASKKSAQATMTECNKCRSDMKSTKYDNAGEGNDWTGVARCHLDAVGFVEMKCCGVSAECAGKKANKFGRHSCGMAPFGDQGKGKTPCEWSVASRCPAVVARQRMERSPKGCCLTSSTGKDKKVTWKVEQKRQVQCCDGDNTQPKFAGTCPKKTSEFVAAKGDDKAIASACKKALAAKTPKA